MYNSIHGEWWGVSQIFVTRGCIYFCEYVQFVKDVISSRYSLRLRIKRSTACIFIALKLTEKFTCSAQICIQNAVIKCPLKCNRNRFWIKDFKKERISHLICYLDQFTEWIQRTTVQLFWSILGRSLCIWFQMVSLFLISQSLWFIKLLTYTG